jgi:hypothetical protein
MLAFWSSVDTEHSRISQCYFGLDIRDAAAPNFIASLFGPKSYPFRGFPAKLV